MDDSLRNEYLEAMGVQPWVARDAVVPVDAPDWAELEQLVSGCTLCGLQESRTRTVFGVGNRNADWLVIGEAPPAGRAVCGPCRSVADRDVVCNRVAA